MKKPALLLLSFIFLNLTGFSQTSNGSGSGDWNNAATWSGGSVPGSTGSVEIISGDTVTVNSVQDCKRITIDAGGMLRIISGAALSTSSTVTVNGTLTMEAGTFNVGNTKTKYLDIAGGTLNFSGGTINVTGRYKQLSGGNAYLSGNAVLNVGVLPGQNNATIHIFSVTTNGVFSVAAGSSAQIVLKNGNSGVASEIYYSPTNSEFYGGSFFIENGSSISDIYFDSDVPIFNLKSDVGVGNTFHFASGCHLQMNNFTILSGKACADAGARIDINGTAYLGSDGSLSFDIDSSAAASIYFSQAPAEKVKADIYLNKAKFHYISSPVSTSQTFSALNMGLTGGNGNDSFYYWDEAQEYNGVIGNWVDILNGSDGTGSASQMTTNSFQTAKGYTIRYQHASHTLSLTGNVLDADQSVAVTRTSGSTGEGWNLVGNPFTASIAANSSAGGNNLLSANSGLLDPVYDGIYLWDEQPSYQGNRDDDLPVSNASPSTYISSGQSFMVKVKTSGNLSFSKDLQNNDASVTFYKNDTADNWIRCWFGLSRKGKLKNETLIAFGAEMTKDLDVSYDVGDYKMNSATALYTKLVNDDGYDFSIQALPPLNTPETIKVGLDADSTGDYVLSLVRDENLSDTTTILLEDKKTGALINLRKGNEYSFSVDKPGRISDRFTLYFNQKITGTSAFTAPDTLPVKLKVIQHQVIVKNVTHKSVRCILQIVNILGQRLFYQNIKLTAGERYSTRIYDERGVVIISLSNDHFQESEKVIF